MRELFTPQKIKDIEIKNRIVLPPIACLSFAKENGFVSEKNIKHYEAIAKSGTGLIVVEATSVSEKGRMSKFQLGIWSDAYIEGLSKIAMACHKHDSKVFIQLHHAGMKAVNNTNEENISSSYYNDGKISARAMTIDEIKEIQQNFVDSVVRAEKAGFDGVEFHGAHGYLMTQFFSAKINNRKDQYGGNLENRLRFTTEIFEKIKQNVSSKFIIGIRMGCNESDLKTSIEMAKKFEEIGMDYIHVSTGFDNTPISEELPKDFLANWIVYGAAKIKEHVNIPVIAVNLINTSHKANYLIENNFVDFVAIGRAQLADYEFTERVKNGKPITMCLRCKPCKWFTNGDNCPGHLK